MMRVATFRAASGAPFPPVNRGRHEGEQAHRDRESVSVAGIEADRRVEVDGGAESARLRIAVNDVGTAEARLQRVLLEDETLVVKEFSRPSASLEDIFVDLVEDGPTDA